MFVASRLELVSVSGGNRRFRAISISFRRLMMRYHTDEAIVTCLKVLDLEIRFPEFVLVVTVCK
jgi:hypothetical protein